MIAWIDHFDRNIDIRIAEPTSCRDGHPAEQGSRESGACRGAPLITRR
jgi:hypothetical protein